jgi:hypothetical protein
MAEKTSLPSESPLAKAAYAEIQKGLAAVAAGVKHCELARAAGLDCTEWESTLDLLRGRLDQLKAVYFPDRA